MVVLQMSCCFSKIDGFHPAVLEFVFRDLPKHRFFYLSKEPRTKTLFLILIIDFGVIKELHTALPRRGESRVQLPR